MAMPTPWMSPVLMESLVIRDLSGSSGYGQNFPAASFAFAATFLTPRPSCQARQTAQVDWSSKRRLHGKCLVPCLSARATSVRACPRWPRRLPWLPAGSAEPFAGSHPCRCSVHLGTLGSGHRSSGIDAPDTILESRRVFWHDSVPSRAAVQPLHLVAPTASLGEPAFHAMCHKVYVLKWCYRAQCVTGYANSPIR